jgi:ligand-binding sensor domain-containing protein
MFELYRLGQDEDAQGINTLSEDHQGTIWAATNGGLYRLTQVNSRWTSRLVDLAPGKREAKIRVLELHGDRKGTVGVSLPGNVLRRLWPDGRIDRYTTLGFRAKPSNESSDEGIVKTMVEDHEGRLWLATNRGLALLVRRPDSDRPEVVRVYTTKDGLRDDNVTALLESSAGKLWAGTETGQSEFCPASTCGRERFRSYTIAFPPGRSGVWTLTEDRDGNVRMAYDVGAFRMARDAHQAALGCRYPESAFTIHEDAPDGARRQSFGCPENSKAPIMIASQAIPVEIHPKVARTVFAKSNGG